MAACRTSAPDPEQPAQSSIPSVLAGVCEPEWADRGKLVRARKTVDVIRDLADYEAATNS